jgi:hypothetical protein
MKKVLGIIILFVIFPLLLVGSIPIWLGFLSHKPFWGFIGAILALFIVWISFALGAGAERLYKYNKPTQFGQWLEAITRKMMILQSTKFIINPIQEMNKMTQSSFSLSGLKHKNIYRKIKEDSQKGLSPKEIIAKHKLTLHEDTLRTIIKEGEAGRFDT